MSVPQGRWFRLTLVTLLTCILPIVGAWRARHAFAAYEEAMASERSIDFSGAYSRLFDNAFTFTNNLRTLSYLDDALRLMQLRAGDRVADVGCGNGVYTFEFARRVGESGKVYGVEINPDLIENLALRIPYEGLRNVVPVLSRQDDVCLAPGSVRVMMMKGVVHCYCGRAYSELAFANVIRPFHDSLYRALTPGGYLLVMDNEDSTTGVVLSDVVRLFAVSGFRVVKSEKMDAGSYVAFRLLLQRP